jgi:5-methylcytosine-specific restriction endonuclease McrA
LLNKQEKYLRLKPHFQVWNAQRRARVRLAEGSFSREDIELKYQEQSGCCKWCNVELNGKYNIDHVVPIAKGGTNYPDNLVLACEHCNKSKGAKMLDEWLGYKNG